MNERCHLDTSILYNCVLVARNIYLDVPYFRKAPSEFITFPFLKIIHVTLPYHRLTTTGTISPITASCFVSPSPLPNHYFGQNIESLVHCQILILPNLVFIWGGKATSVNFRGDRPTADFLLRWTSIALHSACCTLRNSYPMLMEALYPSLSQFHQVWLL